MEWNRLKNGRYRRVGNTIELVFVSSKKMCRKVLANKFLKFMGLKADKTFMTNPVHPWELGQYFDTYEYDKLVEVDKKFENGFVEFWHMITFRPLTEKVATRVRTTVPSDIYARPFLQEPLNLEFIERRYRLVFPVRD